MRLCFHCTSTYLPATDLKCSVLSCSSSPALPALLLWGVFPLSPLNLSTLLQLLSLFFSVSVIFFFTVLFLQSSVTFLTESPPRLHIPLPTSFGSLSHKPLGTAIPLHFVSSSSLLIHFSQGFASTTQEKQLCQGHR